MTAGELIERLEPLGTASYRKVLLNHGVQPPLLGVKISDLKKVQRETRKDYRLSLELFDTGIYDAQYLAGLMADESRMTRADLQGWLDRANCAAIATFPVAWIAAESVHARELAVEWIGSEDEIRAQAGWSTLASLVAITRDEELDLPLLEGLVAHVEETIHHQPNFVRYWMNEFVLSVGTHVRPLTRRAEAAGERIGPVAVDMGNTSCQVPDIVGKIRQAEARGTLGKKRRMARC